MRVKISAFEKYPAYSIKKAEVSDKDNYEDFIVDMDVEKFKRLKKAKDEWEKAEREIAEIYSEIENKKNDEYRKKNSIVDI